MTRTLPAFLFSAAAFLLAQSVASVAQPAQSLRIYQFTGVYQNDGTANSGTATIFTCTNFVDVTTTLRFLIRDSSGVTVLDLAQALGSKSIATYATKGTVAHAEVILGASGVFNNASMAISSTQREVRCMGKVTPAADAAPGGYVLPFARFFQTADTEE